MVSVGHLGVIFQMYHMTEKIWWGIITSLLTIYILRLKIKAWADMEATYIMLLSHIA